MFLLSTRGITSHFAIFVLRFLLFHMNDSVQSNHESFLEKFRHNRPTEKQNTVHRSRNESLFGDITDLMKKESLFAVNSRYLVRGGAVLTEGEREHNSSKSALYRNIYKELPLLIGQLTFEHQLICANRCGSSVECSCKPICLFLNTCCVDFLESCGDVYDIDQFLYEYRWLESASTECVANSLIVTSCRQSNEKGNDSSAHYSDDELHVDHFPDTSTWQQTANSSLKVALVDVIKFLFSNREQIPTDETVRLLMAVPLVDTWTGITYKNLSLYACNGASLSHARMWVIKVPLRANALIPSSSIERIDQISFFMNMSDNECPVAAKNPYNGDGHNDKNVEQCRDNLFATCPEGFPDEDVKAACQNVNFFVNVERNDGSLVVMELFKNPFCIICNKGYISHVDNPKYFPSPLPLHSSRSCDKFLNALNVDFNPIKYAYDVTISIDIGLVEVVSGWKELSCTFSHSSKLLGEKNSSKNALGFSKQNQRQNSWPFTTKCRIKTCRYFEVSLPGSSSQVTCTTLSIFVVGFPPAKSQPHQTYLEAVLMRLTKMFISSTLGSSDLNKTVSDFSTIDYNHDKERSFGGKKFVYFFSVWIYTLVGVPHSVELTQHRQPLVDLLQEIDYDHQTGMNYVCFTTEPYWRIQSSSFCSEECIIYTNRTVAAQQSVNVAIPSTHSGKLFPVSILLIVSLSCQAWI